jgi:hypothetical protein
MFVGARLKYHVKIVIIHFIAFLDFKDITKGLTSHERYIRSYFQVQVRVREYLDKDFAEIRILSILNRVIGIKIQERALTYMFISRDITYVVIYMAMILVERILAHSDTCYIR